MAPAYEVRDAKGVSHARARLRARCAAWCGSSARRASQTARLSATLRGQWSALEAPMGSLLTRRAWSA